MTHNKEILPQYRDQSELELKDMFLWAIGQNAITEMTKTVRERERAVVPTIYTTPATFYSAEKCSTQ